MDFIINLHFGLQEKIMKALQTYQVNSELSWQFIAFVDLGRLFFFRPQTGKSI